MLKMDIVPYISCDVTIYVFLGVTVFLPDNSSASCKRELTKALATGSINKDFTVDNFLSREIQLFFTSIAR